MDARKVIEMEKTEVAQKIELKESKIWKVAIEHHALKTKEEALREKDEEKRMEVEKEAEEAKKKAEKAKERCRKAQNSPQ